MIKPDGLFGNYTDEIKKVILESGFSILEEMMVQLDENYVTIFYAEHSKKSFFPRLVKYMTSGPVFVMVLEKVNAIADWRALIGPTDARKAKVTHPNSIRALCGLDSEKNCVHGSDSPQSAAREISFFFEEISSGLERDRLDARRCRTYASLGERKDGSGGCATSGKQISDSSGIGMERGPRMGV
ncbi:hypothetical protein HHK36_021890 [Tetracentron sinense]|uniref:Nucleoside diphosphate kinase n=1 Tax=Tetracentron sinense TaxID=13715 RepID=A0A834YQK7_TETSI|nr:hypothetical protein HHK36_021890 [Tetracentron sinense]